MVTPTAVDSFQQQSLLNLAHTLCAVLGDSFCCILVGRSSQTFPHRFVVDAFLSRPVFHRQVLMEIFLNTLFQRVSIPLIGIGAFRHVSCDQIVDDGLAHFFDGVGQVGTFHHFASLAEDRLTLIVHHVIEFQEVLADIKVPRLNFGLRFFNRLIHPGMNNRFAFVQAQLLQHRIHPLGPENAHQIVFQRQVECRPPRVALTT